MKMKEATRQQERSTNDVLQLPLLWVRLSFAAAVIAAAGSLAGLLASSRIYGQETIVLADASGAQDIVGLIVAPAIIVLGGMAARGSVMAYLGWLGCLIFTTYNYAIYAFSIHFGPLFLLWVAVLGLSAYAIAGSLTASSAAVAKSRFRARALPVTAWVLISLGVLFGVLWLYEIIPDVIAGRPSTSAVQWQVPTNPVHVLDLALFLPAVLTSGVLLLRRQPLGYATAPALLVFLALTCCPILLTPAVAQVRGHEVSGAVIVPIGLVFAVTTVVLCQTLRRAQ